MTPPTAADEPSRIPPYRRVFAAGRRVTVPFDGRVKGAVSKVSCSGTIDQPARRPLPRCPRGEGQRQARGPAACEPMGRNMRCHRPAIWSQSSQCVGRATAAERLQPHKLPPHKLPPDVPNRTGWVCIPEGLKPTRRHLVLIMRPGPSALARGAGESVLRRSP